MKEYLTEERLKSILDSSKYEFIHDKCIKGLGRFRPDFRCEELKLIIEFNGFYHYTDPETIFRDGRKVMALFSADYYVIHIPYFIQMTPEVYHWLFIMHGYDLGIDEGLLDYGYPHGFIDKNVHCPAEFCTHGLEIFRSDMEVSFRPFAFEVLMSLALHDKEFQLKYPFSSYIMKNNTPDDRSIRLFDPFEYGEPCDTYTDRLDEYICLLGKDSLELSKLEPVSVLNVYE